jgi:hypothetical protein
MKNYMLLLMSAISMGWATSAQSALTFWKSGDLMIITGTAAAEDVEKLKAALTPAIKTIVVRASGGTDFAPAKALSQIIEDAGVTTVVHGTCEQLGCSMLFLAGKQRMFSGVGPATAHTLTIGIGEPTHVFADNTRVETMHEWWRSHTKLSRSDLSLYRESFFSTVGATSKFDRKVFFPAQAKFSKGNVLHCSGNAKSQQWVDCMSVPDATALSKGIVTTDELFADARLSEAPDIAVPAATNVAALNGELTVLTSDRCKEIYRDYLKQDLPRAFVVSNQGGCHWTSLAIRPFDRAMKACEKEVVAGKECRFYSVDNAIVFTPFDQPKPHAIAAPTVAVNNALVLDQSNTTLLLARTASADDGPGGVNDRFSVEGKIIAYMTFKWDVAKLRSGGQRLEVRWFSGEKLVSSQQSDVTLTASPHRTWMSVLSADIGVGKARVDVFADGKLIASKVFEVVEKL